MITRLKLLGLMAVISILALCSVYHVGKHNQRQQSALDAAQAVTKAIHNRAQINETINNMDSIALCLELGGGRDQCEQLCGLAEDQR